MPGAAAAGVVVDEAAGKPIAGARISVMGQTAVSGAEGKFSFPGLPASSLTAEVTADGFVPRRFLLTPPEAALAVHLERSVRVFGVIADSEDRPVSGARVTARRLALTASGADEMPLPAAVSDADGRYEGMAPPGMVMLSAEAVGSGSMQGGRMMPLMGRSNIVHLRPGVPGNIDVTLAPAGVLAGQVSRLNGTHARGCLIEAEDSVAGEVLAGGAADAEGRFELTGLPQGIPLSLRARCPDGRADLGGLEAAAPAGADAPRTLLVLGQRSVAGTVVDGRGRPVPGALIDVSPIGLEPPWPPAGGRSVWTADVAGRFRVTGLSGDVFSVRASSQRSGRARLDGVLADSTDIVLVLADVGIAGRLREADGSPVKDAVVAAVPLESGPARTGRFVTSDGTFRLPLSPGRYRLWAERPGTGGRRAASLVPQEVTVSADGWTQLELSLPPPASGSENVRAAAAAETPVPGAPAQKNAAAPKPVFPGWAGMRVGEKAGSLFVAASSLFGPARAAGIRDGDEIQAIDGIQARGWDASRAENALRGSPGTPVVVAVLRDGASEPLTFQIFRTPMPLDADGSDWPR